MSTLHTPRYPHLALLDWPFRILPVRGNTTVWAGRQEVESQVKRLIRQLGRNSVSSLHLMWADFGAGKTHTLYYVEPLAKEHSLFPVYVEWPKKTTTFVDVYRGIANHFSLRVLSQLFWKCCEHKGVDEVLDSVSQQFPDFATILERIYDNDRTSLVHEWLRAQPGVGRRELATIGIRNPIKTSDDAVRSVVVLVNLVAGSGDYVKLLLMLDEFQRIDHLPPRIRRDVNTGIRTMLNACPDSLSIILSFSFGRPENIDFLLTEEVRSLADPESIHLPQMTKVEAMEFVEDLLKSYRSSESVGPLFPFTAESCQVVLDHAGKLTPRRIMKRFNVVLRRADEDIEGGVIAHVTPEYAVQILRKVPALEEEEGEDEG